MTTKATPIIAPSETLSSLRVPNLMEYFGLWAIHEQTFLDVVDGLNGMDLIAHVRAAEPFTGTSKPGYELANNGTTAVVRISGPIMKGDTSLMDNTSTVRMQRLFRDIAKSEHIKSVLNVYDTPGGTMAGVPDLADELNRLMRTKHVVSFMEDQCCSAGYLLASQAHEVLANRNAIIGSIGAYSVLRDTSAAANRIGLKVHVVKYGDAKATGVPGTEITDDQLAEVQRVVNSMGDLFVAAVASGRRMTIEQARKLADGRVHVGAEAIPLKLIDGVESFDAVLERLAAVGKPKTTIRSQRTMSDDTDNKPVAATLADLEAACEGASADFILAQLKRGATVQQATAEHIKTLRAEADKARAEATKAKADAEAAQAAALSKPKAQKEVESAKKADDATDPTGDPVAEWNTAVDAHVKRGKSKRAAISAVCHENPELHAAYLGAHNETHGRGKAFERSRFAQ